MHVAAAHQTGAFARSATASWSGCWTRCAHCCKQGGAHLDRSEQQADLHPVCAQACCTIVSSLSNEVCDSYVLSESSLFVFATKAVLKTCGTTRPLSAMPLLLDLVHGLDMAVTHVRYSRASFLFPQSQASTQLKGLM